MIYNLETLDRVIDKICRDLGLGQDDIPYTDFIEWIADGLQHIGAYQQFLEKECFVKIEDYEGLLPCDLHKVIRFKLGYETCEKADEILEEANIMSAYDRYTYSPTLAPLINTLQNNAYLIGNPKVNKNTNLDYNVNFNKITTAFRYGVIQIQYLALPVDERGWPMIPDNVSFRDALFWKCAYHMSMRDPNKLRNQRMQDMEYCRQQWNRTCVQARAEATMPNIHGMERLKNQWLSLLNITNLEQNEYRGLGLQQRLNLNGRL